MIFGKLRHGAPSEPAGMRILDRKPRVSRREFLKGSGLAAIGVKLVPGTALLAKTSEAFAQSFTNLSADVGKTLLRMARDIFPHDRLSEKYYMQAVEPYDSAAAKDPALRKLIDDGVRTLNAAANKRFGKPYADVPEEADRVVLLQEIESSPFFQKIRGDLVTGLYNNKAVWSEFGYEGSSWEKGGYLNRGFNDIDWV